MSKSDETITDLPDWVASLCELDPKGDGLMEFIGTDGMRLRHVHQALIDVVTQNNKLRREVRQLSNDVRHWHTKYIYLRKF